MKGLFHGKDLKAFSCAIGPSEFNSRLTCLCSAIAKKYFSRERPSDDLFGKFQLVRMIKIIWKVDQLADLVTYCRDDLGVTVADIAYPPSRKEV